MLMTFSTLVACGSGQGAPAGAAPEETTTAGVQGKSLNKADLERAVITETDLDGYEVNPILAGPSASRRTQGGTVAMFYAFNLPAGPRGKEPAVIPEAIIKAQLNKLGELTDSK